MKRGLGEESGRGVWGRPYYRARARHWRGRCLEGKAKMKSGGKTLEG